MYHYSSLRDCSTVLNIEPQPHRYHWVAAGEASLWTTTAITDFCRFTFSAYNNLKMFRSLKTKFDHTFSSVVDMSLLWLWWVAHTPLQEFVANSSVRNYFDAYIPGGRKQNDVRLFEALSFSKSLYLPTVQANLTLCNGMLIRNDSVFDHMHAWQRGFTFSLNIDEFVAGRGLPFARLKSGDKMLLFLNIHYQGDSKKILPFDFCRILSAKAKVRAEDKAYQGWSKLTLTQSLTSLLSTCEGVFAAREALRRGQKKADPSCGEHVKGESTICF